MGVFDFKYEGKTYSISIEEDCPILQNDEEMEVFEKWRKTPKGIGVFDPIPYDWSQEHCLDDRYPWDNDKERRVDIEDPENEEPYIDWCYYDKCRYGCYRQFYLTNDAHNCNVCGVFSCKGCAEGSFRKLSMTDDDEWVCGKCYVVKSNKSGKQRGKINCKDQQK